MKVDIPVMVSFHYNDKNDIHYTPFLCRFVSIADDSLLEIKFALTCLASFQELKKTY